MVVKIENGKIIQESVAIPKTVQKIIDGKKNVVFGYDKLNPSIHFTDGWREVVFPDFNEDTHYLGHTYYDVENDIATTDVVEIEYELMDIEEIRAEKHEAFERILEKEMTPALMFGVIDKLAMGEPIPPETMGVIAALRTREAQVKADIDAITDAKTLKLFGFDREEIEQSKQLLKGGRKL
jgi:hypothetical protein